MLFSGVSVLFCAFEICKLRVFNAPRGSIPTSRPNLESTPYKMSPFHRAIEGYAGGRFGIDIAKSPQGVRGSKPGGPQEAPKRQVLERGAKPPQAALATKAS